MRRDDDDDVLGSVAFDLETLSNRQTVRGWYPLTNEVEDPGKYWTKRALAEKEDTSPRVDKLVLNSTHMQVNVLAFGPIADKIGGREHQIDIPPNSSVRFLLEEMGLDMWLGQGIVISINGTKVGEDEPISEGDEVALLPPVSGG